MWTMWRRSGFRRSKRRCDLPILDDQEHLERRIGFAIRIPETWIMHLAPRLLIVVGVAFVSGAAIAAEVEGQPLGANVVRVMQALEFLGAPLTVDETASLQQ